METRIPGMLAVIITTLLLSLLFVTTRVVIRCMKGGIGKKGFWWDEVLIMLAEMTLTGSSLAKLTEIPHGAGRHLADISESARVDKMLRSWYASQVLYFITMGLIKLTILFFYVRLSDELRKPVWWVMALVVATTIGTVGTAVFQCTPIMKFWNPEKVENGTCINIVAYGVATGAVSMVSDIIIYTLPMRTLWKVQLPRRQRVGLLLVFAVGGFVVITGILRMHSLTLMSVTKDPTWVNVPVQMWSSVELNVAAICASLPSLKPVFTCMVGTRDPNEPPTSLRVYIQLHSFPRFRRRRLGRRVDDPELADPSTWSNVETRVAPSSAGATMGSTQSALAHQSQLTISPVHPTVLALPWKDKRTPSTSAIEGFDQEGLEDWSSLGGPRY